VALSALFHEGRVSLDDFAELFFDGCVLDVEVDESELEVALGRLDLDDELDEPDLVVEVDDVYPDNVELDERDLRRLLEGRLTELFWRSCDFIALRSRSLAEEMALPTLFHGGRVSLGVFTGFFFDGWFADVEFNELELDDELSRLDPDDELDEPDLLRSRMLILMMSSSSSPLYEDFQRVDLLSSLGGAVKKWLCRHFSTGGDFYWEFLWVLLRRCSLKVGFLMVKLGVTEEGEKLELIKGFKSSIGRPFRRFRLLHSKSN
jgi:hypothetical protein